MNTFIQEIILNPRNDVEGYNVQANESAIEILSLVYEFKIATGRQLARFLEQREESKYLYLKLRRMWRAGFLDSFRVYTGSRFGMPVYYLLTQKGLDALASAKRYEERDIDEYPNLKTLISPSCFKHEAAIVELASLEAKNHSEQISISFRGELSSISRDFRSAKDIEIFTPDFTARYSFKSDHRTIYTEFERTPKSKEVMLAKLERYVRYLDFEERQRSILRFIFETPAMERSFWLTIIKSDPNLLTRLHIVTSSVPLLSAHEHFLEPVYVSGDSVQIKKENRPSADLSRRVKLISFL